LIALIANARRSVRLSPPAEALAPANGSKRPDSTRQSTGPTPEDRGRTGVGLFEKTSFASNASGSLSGQARLTTGLERRRDMRADDKPRGLTSSRPGRSTECVSSSQCQIVIARQPPLPRTRS
jgi:hypothetical protein